MAIFFAFFTLLTFFIAVPSAFSAKIPEPEASSRVQAAQAPPITNASLKPMTTTYIVAGSKSTEKKEPQDITSEASEADSEGKTAIASSASSGTPTSASTTRTRPHHTSFLTARAGGVQQAQARAGNAVHPQATKATPGSTHAHHTTFYGAGDKSYASQSGGNGQVKVGAGQQGQVLVDNRQMQAVQGSNGAQKGDEAQNECEEEEEEEEEEELEDCDEEEEIDDGDNEEEEDVEDNEEDK